VGVGVVVGLVIGLVVGVVLGWLWAARRTNEQVQAAATDLARAQAELEAERRILEARRADQEALERFVQGPLAETTQRVLLQVGGSLRAENDLLLRQAQQAGASELDARRQAIEGLIGPLRAELERLQGEVRALETKREGAYAQLREQMQQLTESEARLAQTAGELVQALRRPTTRGRWGELQLRRVVELAGMTSYCDFTEQPSSTTDDGSRQRPDLVVRLPGEAEVVVDAKVPLEAYLQALEAPDETARKEALARHARQLREHVHTLATKAYWSQRPRTPELVVAFVPGDALLAAALEADPALLDDAIA
jgi:DNA recombination protein RmuC